MSGRGLSLPLLPLDAALFPMCFTSTELLFDGTPSMHMSVMRRMRDIRGVEESTIRELSVVRLLRRRSRKTPF